MQRAQRSIRVFVSSTFRDMQDEREELVKHIFPQLRKLCESRGVTWCDVDLRWGVTDEQKAEGKVLPICLEEIKRCRPYFIGLLGERYGWIPEAIAPEIIERQPWLAEHVNGRKSVTELEILHGVLNNPEMANRACFYFRDPAYVNKVSADKKDDFIEQDPQTQQKLKKLKDKIRSSGLAVHENYPNPKALGRLVLQDLTTAINQEFPPETIPETLDREAAEHEAFAQSRAGVYIGRNEYFEKLDKHAAGDGSPLVILGESGCGKSALLANWALRYRLTHPDELLIMHFIGASAYSADWAGMVRRIMGELKHRFDISGDIPDKPDELRLAFANWLNMAAAKAKVIIILDALNQLDDRDGAVDLVWLPPVIPSNIRLIVSTLPGRSLDELKKRNWPIQQVELLNTDERRKLIVEYLGQYTKSLTKKQIDRILSVSQTANALFLRAMLEELRLFGKHEKLDERIDYYLTAKTIPQLYEKILERYEQDYQRERPSLVKEAMSLIWASRRGLSEAELLEMLGQNGEQLPRTHWSPLYLAAEQSLVNRSGLIGFFHDYLRQAVQHKYLSAEKEQIEFHLRIADYFKVKEINPRKVDELPWQLSQAKSWQRLYELLSELPFFEACWNTNQFDLKGYWASVEANSSLRMIDAYSTILKNPQSCEIEYIWNIASLFADTGHPSEAFSLRGFLVKQYCRIGNKAALSGCLGNQALILTAWGRLDEAMQLHKQQEALCNKLGDKVGLSISLGNQANILADWGRLNEAMQLCKQEEALCNELGDKAGLSRSLGNQALILEAWGRLDEAMQLHKQEEALCNELGNKAQLSISFGNQAIILRDWGRLNEAMQLCKQQEALCKELGDKASLSISLSNQALILWDWGRLEESIQLYKQLEVLCKELGNKAHLSTCLGNQANILRDWGRLDEAMQLHKQEEALKRELGDKAGLSISLNNQAVILRDWGRLDEAMRLLNQKEAICNELGDKAGLSACLGNKALILRVWGQLEEAMQLHKQEESLAKELGNKSQLSRSLGNHALILRDWGRLDEAMQLLKQKEAICIELGDKAGLSLCLGNQALILRDWGQLEEAMQLHKQEEALKRELGDKAGLSLCLGNQASIFYYWSRLEEAMKLYKQQEVLCKELSYKPGLSRSFCGQANIFYSWGRLEEALQLYKQEETLCKELCDKAGLARSLGNQALILKAWGRLEEAIQLHKQKEALKRELGDKEGLARSFINQALIISENKSQLKEGLTLAEEAYRIATEHNFVALANQMKPILASIRYRLFLSRLNQFWNRLWRK